MPTQTGDKAWYLAQLKPNGHRIAQKNLLRQGFEVFLPLAEETRRYRGRFVQREAPLFPGYIFVSFDPAASGWRAVNSTQGISRLVGTGAAPTPVPNALVAGLMARCDASGHLRPEAELVPGQEVRVISGPFADFVARVETIAADQRVSLLIDLLGQKTRISVSLDGLRRQ